MDLYFSKFYVVEMSLLRRLLTKFEETMTIDEKKAIEELRH